jgi:hypothetical protein
MCQNWHIFIFLIPFDLGRTNYATFSNRGNFSSIFEFFGEIIPQIFDDSGNFVVLMMVGRGSVMLHRLPNILSPLRGSQVL